ncbi:MAG: FAD binding domain-containing protein [Candidatus Rokuibacteriota bacterium]
MSRFEYHQPESLPDAIALAARFGAEASFLAGGTDLIVQIERGRIAPRHVVGLQRVPGLAGIEVNGRIALGARVTHRSIERAPALAGALRCLIEGAEVIGGHQVRNVGTVGGNLVNASPAADLAPCLLALDGTVTLVGPGGERELPVERFLLGPNRTARRLDELLTRVSLPALPARAATAFLKAGRRRAMEISVVCVAARLTLDASLERCLEARVALGAVAPTAVRAHQAERALEGRPVGPETFRRAAEAAQEACRPIDDVRASSGFRQHLVGVLVRRALDRCVERARSAAWPGHA